MTKWRWKERIWWKETCSYHNHVNKDPIMNMNKKIWRWPIKNQARRRNFRPKRASRVPTVKCEFTSERNTPGSLALDYKTKYHKIWYHKTEWDIGNEEISSQWQNSDHDDTKEQKRWKNRKFTDDIDSTTIA